MLKVGDKGCENIFSHYSNIIYYIPAMQSLVDEEKMSKSGVGRWAHKTSRTPPLEV